MSNRSGGLDYQPSAGRPDSAVTDRALVAEYLMVERRLLSELEACEQLGICRKTLKDHVRAGDIRYVLIGKRIRK